MSSYKSVTLKTNQFLKSMLSIQNISGRVLQTPRTDLIAYSVFDIQQEGMISLIPNIFASLFNYASNTGHCQAWTQNRMPLMTHESLPMSHSGTKAFGPLLVYVFSKYCARWPLCSLPGLVKWNGHGHRQMFQCIPMGICRVGKIHINSIKR